MTCVSRVDEKVQHVIRFGIFGLGPRAGEFRRNGLSAPSRGKSAVYKKAAGLIHCDNDDLAHQVRKRLFTKFPFAIP